jgi:hypothetical protein
MYREFYTKATPGARLVDGSTSYAMRPEYPPVASLAATLAPEASILYVVRNPVHRAISHHKHLVAWDLSPELDFDRAVTRDSRLIDFGRYWWQLEPWLDVFGPDAVKVVLFEHYQAERRKVIASVMDFLGVAPEPAAVNEDVMLNQSHTARAVRDPWRRFLISELYQARLRTRLPPRVRTWLRDSVLPEPVLPAAPSPGAIDRIIDATQDDAEQLSSFLGHGEHLWDWEATRRQFA